MKRLIPYILLFAFVCSTNATITQVQNITSDSGSGAATNTFTLTFGAATTAGNIVVVGVQSNSAVTKVTSANGIFYNATPEAQNTGGTGNLTQIFYGIMYGADTAIVVALLPAASTSRWSASAVEFSGNHIVPDAIPATASSSTSVPATGNVTNLDANALYVGVVAQKGFNSSTENTSWISSTTAGFTVYQITTKVNSGSVDYSVALGWQVYSSIAGRSFAGTSSLGTLQSTGIMATFHEVGASPTPTATASATATNTPTPTATATATATFTPCALTPTPTPTNTPTPTPSATNTPTPTPTPPIETSYGFQG